MKEFPVRLTLARGRRTSGRIGDREKQFLGKPTRQAGKPENPTYSNPLMLCNPLWLCKIKKDSAMTGLPNSSTPQKNHVKQEFGEYRIAPFGDLDPRAVMLAIKLSRRTRGALEEILSASHPAEPRRDLDIFTSAAGQIEVSFTPARGH